MDVIERDEYLTFKAHMLGFKVSAEVLCTHIRWRIANVLLATND
jgi:hypothetical protein